MLAMNRKIEFHGKKIEISFASRIMFILLTIFPPFMCIFVNVESVNIFAFLIIYFGMLGISINLVKPKVFTQEV